MYKFLNEFCQFTWWQFSMTALDHMIVLVESTPANSRFHKASNMAFDKIDKLEQNFMFIVFWWDINSLRPSDAYMHQ